MKEKITEVLKSLQGLNYEEWVKVKTTVDSLFEKDTCNQMLRLPIAGVQDLIEEYERLF